MARINDVETEHNQLALQWTPLGWKTKMESFCGSPVIRVDARPTASSFDALEYDQPDIDAARLPNGEADPGSCIQPFWPRSLGRGSKWKRIVCIWHCCACGKAGIGIMVECCPDCGASRCPYCRTEKVRVQ